MSENWDRLQRKKADIQTKEKQGEWQSQYVAPVTF